MEKTSEALKQLRHIKKEAPFSLSKGSSHFSRKRNNIVKDAKEPAYGGRDAASAAGEYQGKVHAGAYLLRSSSELRRRKPARGLVVLSQKKGEKERVRNRLSARGDLGKEKNAYPLVQGRKKKREKAKTLVIPSS